jgi:hypothetical protein
MSKPPHAVRRSLSRPGRRRSLVVGGPLIAVAIALVVIVGQASAGAGDPSAHANPDSYSTGNVGTLAVGTGHGVLANDGGRNLQLVSHSEPSNGSLTLNPDGSFNYVPQSGFTGDDSFSYTISNAVQLFKTNLPPLGFFGGVTLTGGAFGSSLYPVPGHDEEFYGLEDRGPNVSAPNGHDVLPIPSYDPAIAKFRFKDGKAEPLKTVPLEDASGHPYSGLVNTDNTTGETVEDLNGHVLANDPNGYDPEGLVALPDGTFWVSDEYGPFITHFRSDGRAIQRLSPIDGSLPKELQKRVPNRGMEGLTITPDGKTLVGTMQSALQQTDLNGADAKKLVPIRIVTYGLKNHQLHEYLYLLHDPKTTGTAVSEITALSNTSFLMDERDGNFPAAGGFKQLWKVDISHATDVGPSGHVAAASYDPANGGLLVGGKTIEALTNGQTTAQAATTLSGAGIAPVSESLFLDVDSLLLSLDPQGRFFSHDKLEGVAAIDGGKKIVISNDSDFGISGVTNTAAPWTLQAKISPATHKQDDGEYLEIDTGKLSAATSTATVTIHVHNGP